MAPSVNIWWRGRWYGPAYPGAGDPPGWPRGGSGEVTEPAGADLPDFDELDPDDPSRQLADDLVDQPPPRAGKGSGTTVWAAYARSHGVAIPDGADRGEIIDALDAAGIRTE